MKRKGLLIIFLSAPVFAIDVAIIAQGKLPWIQAGLPFIATFVVFFAMLASYWILRAVLNRKADVE